MGGKNIIKYMISELLDNATRHLNYPLKFQNDFPIYFYS